MKKNGFALLSLWLVTALLNGSLRAEQEVQLIPLAAPLNSPLAQLSGLTWCGEELLLLPQKPRFTNNDSGPKSALYSVSKAQVLKALTAKTSSPLVANTIEFDDKELRAGLFGFDGYEAVACDGQQLWLAIETKVNLLHFTTSIVKAQRVEPNLIKVAHKVHSTIKSGSDIWNFSDETVVLAPDALITIHEANATKDQPMATAISLISGKQIQIPIPSLPYRITDATKLDQENRFWVINYLWQGDKHLRDNHDWLAKKYPPGDTHHNNKNIERLVELELTNTGIRRTDTPPIYLRLSQKKGRNWEGLVRLGEQGFLLVTDQFPATYFGFVPLP